MIVKSTRELRRKLRAKRRAPFKEQLLNVMPSPSGMWWFLDQLTPEERRKVNEALHGDAVVGEIQRLYARHPQLAAEAMRH